MRKAMTAVVTGSTGGIGGAVCDELASQGWSLILVNRSQSKAFDQKERLVAKYPDITVDLVETDLMDLTRIEQSCREIEQKAGRVDALYGIAGVLTSERRLSAQGYESHYAVNVLANCVLIRNLIPIMTMGESLQPPMIVTMSSSAIKRGALDIENLSDPPKIGGLMGAYAQSKLALTAICAEMAPELEALGIRIRAIDPGPTKTSMTAGGDGMPLVLKWLAPILFSDPQKQAAKIVAAADPEAFGGATGIFVSSGRQNPLPKSIASQPIRGQLLEKIHRDCQAPQGQPA
ncbi:MAG: SDR family NAD(P)-dependent oxidoreductase [Pseudomonadota bacterium]